MVDRAGASTSAGAEALVVRLDRRVRRERRAPARRRRATTRSREDTLVTVDIGCVVDGYCSDCTRTFATGELPDALRDAYELVSRAQLDGLAAVSAGARGRERRRRLARRDRRPPGLADAYGHGLGHGVGHGDPRGADASGPSRGRPRGRERRHRRAGPLPARASAAVRIEDLVVVTEDGCESLTHVHEGAGPTVRARYPAAPSWPRSSTRTSSRTACTSSTRAGVADRRVPAREAGQGRRVRAHEAEEPRARARSSTRPSAPARSSRACTPR